MYTLEQLQQKTFGELKAIGWELNVFPDGDRRRRQSWIDAIAGVNPPLLQLLEVSPGVEVDRAQEPIREMVEASPGVEADRAQEPVMETVETSPGVDLNDELPECVECFGDGYFEDESGLIKFCHCSDAEPKLSRQNAQRAIVPAAKISEFDQNPILTGITLSDRFVARYAPPPPAEHHYKIADGPYNVAADGQLSLLFEVVFEEPPDPDDFESIDAFCEAMARWDWEHPSSFDHCCDLFPSSVHSEPNSVDSKPPDPHDFDSMFAFWAAYDAWDEASDDDSEPLEISLDSFCEWAPCPPDWYEPIALLEPSKVLEMSPARKSSITSDFFIPTFDRWGDRSNGSDEPPDAGILARLPKPKPPTFPPQAATWTQVGGKLDTSWTQVSEASRNYPETIPKLFHRVVAGSSTQPARSPPGGDANFA